MTKPVPEMPARLFLSSGDLMADRRFEFARDLQLKGDLPAAADLLIQAIELAPDFTSAWFTLADIREQLGEHEAAVVAYQKAQTRDPRARHGAGPPFMVLRGGAFGRLAPAPLVNPLHHNSPPVG